MIRIYCDKNIFSNIKEGKRNFNSALKILMDELRGKVLFTYSDAHHVDLSNSDKNYWHEDLELMEYYVGENYFVYNNAEKKTELLLAKPTQTFHDYDYNVMKQVQQDPLSLFNSISDEDDEFGFVKIAKGFLDKILDMPVQTFSGNSSENTEHQNEMLRKYLPNGENSTMRDVFNIGIGMLSDPQQVIGMKKLMEEYISSDKYRFDIWKDDFNEKFKENFEGKSFTDLMETTFNAVPNYTEYDKFLIFFNSLDVHNITKDKRLRDTQSLSSTHTDANHAWYASYSDFLVTDDKGLQVKAYITYKYFGIKTEILSMKEFLNRKTTFLHQEETDLAKTFKLLNHEQTTGLVLRSHINNFLFHQNIIKLSHHFFNYFNRLAVSDYDLILYCQRHKNANFVMYREVELLTNKLINFLGVDDKNIGQYRFSEENHNAEIIREWTFGKDHIVFGSAFNNNGKCLSLTIANKNNN